MSSPPSSRSSQHDLSPPPDSSPPDTAEDGFLERQSGVDLRASRPRIEEPRKPRPLRAEPLEPFRPPATILSPPPGATALASERAQTAALVERLLGAPEGSLEPLRWRSSRGTTVDVLPHRRAERLALRLVGGPGAEDDAERLAQSLRLALELRGVSGASLEIEQC